MVATIIRRQSRRAILKDIKREQVDTSKTGIHPNPIVNEAIEKVDVESRGSGPGITTQSNTVPRLLVKRRELEKRGKGVKD
jgi:ribosome maturation protein Sdo1